MTDFHLFTAQSLSNIIQEWAADQITAAKRLHGDERREELHAIKHRAAQWCFEEIRRGVPEAAAHAHADAVDAACEAAETR